MIRGYFIMKKILWIILAFSIILAGCYDDDGTATVRINLGNMPVAQHMQKKSLIDKVLCLFSKEAYAYSDSYINRLHLVAWQNDSQIALNTINTSNLTLGSIDTVEFEVPAEKNITIVVLAEVLYNGQTAMINNISYYGKSESTINLVAGETTTVQISMAGLNESSMQFSFPNGNLSWIKIPGASGYRLYDETGALIANTTDNFYNGANYYQFIIDFDYISLSSSQFSITVP